MSRDLADHVVTSDVNYVGGLRCTATHGPSLSRIETDAPVDNEGKGERFSPTDLVGAALGTCILTICGIVAQRADVDLKGATAHVEKRMNASPRRIGSLVVRITVPPAAAGLLEKLERAAATCPVHHSLHPDIDVRTTFTVADEKVTG